MKQRDRGFQNANLRVPAIMRAIGSSRRQPTGHLVGLVLGAENDNTVSLGTLLVIPKKFIPKCPIPKRHCVLAIVD